MLRVMNTSSYSYNSIDIGIGQVRGKKPAMVKNLYVTLNWISSLEIKTEMSGSKSINSYCFI